MAVIKSCRSWGHFGDDDGTPAATKERHLKVVVVVVGEGVAVRIRLAMKDFMVAAVFRVIVEV